LIRGPFSGGASQGKNPYEVWRQLGWGKIRHLSDAMLGSSWTRKLTSLTSNPEWGGVLTKTKKGQELGDTGENRSQKRLQFVLRTKGCFPSGTTNIFTVRDEILNHVAELN